MTIAYPDILSLKAPPARFEWSEDRAILYALGIGMCADGLDPRELPFVVDPGTVALPTLATVVAWGPNLAVEIAAGLTFEQIVHAYQKVELHRPMPASGSVDVEHEVIGVADKGADIGAFMTTRTLLTLAGGEPLATMTSTVAARGDGGFGGPRSFGEPAHPMPARAPDMSLDIATRPDQALLYRLSGDRNPLHALPDVAREAGFEAPILHGLCSYGISCRAVLAGMLDFDVAAIASHEARFAAPVYPGETLTFDMWRDQDVISFEAKVAARGSTVLRGGRTTLRERP